MQSDRFYVEEHPEYGPPCWWVWERLPSGAVEEVARCTSSVKAQNVADALNVVSRPRVQVVPFLARLLAARDWSPSYVRP